MKVRILLGHMEEAQSAGDLLVESPVFAVVRNQGAPMDSAEAWHAVSIVDLDVADDDGTVDLVADGSDDAKDITVAALRARLKRLPESAQEYEIYAGMKTTLEGESDIREDAPVVEAYSDEHGLGLMLWFEGYEEWIQTQE